jgi:hypothetical protein
MEGSMLRFGAVVAVSLLVTRTAVATDGVIEINQSIALRGGVNGDMLADPAGFPVRITQPGSYRLSGNLTIPLGSAGIQIDAISVTLDLGGFMVSGPNACTGYPTSSCPYSTDKSAIASGQFLVVVRNGTVIGSEGYGVDLQGSSSEVDQLRVIGCGRTGIRVGGAGRVSRSFGGGNLGVGIDVGDGGIAENNEARANASIGIGVGGARLSALATGNRALDNGGPGVSVYSTEVLVTRNVASDNLGGSQIAGGRSLGDNLCTATLC